jgi:hypothetical protein
MEQNKKRDPRYPNSEDQLTHTGHYTDTRDDWNIRPEDSAKLSDPQKLVYKFLLTGWYSSREISLRTGYLDTRSIIRRIKKKGITVLERWYKRQNGEKFKKFTILPPKPVEPENTSGPKSIRDIMDLHFKHLKRDGRDNNTQ